MPIIKIKNSTSSGNTPSTLAQGEVAINVADGKGWVGNASGTPVRIVGSIASQEANNVSITGGTVSVGNFGTSTAATATVGTVNVGGTAMSSVAATNTSTSTTNPMSGAGMYDSGNKLKGRLKNVYSYSSSGTYTWIKSGPDVTRVHVLCCGAGGGARAYSESGGAGGFSEGVFDATGMTSVTVTVGGGSGGGSYFGFSGQGGSSSFGGYISASGGYGANQNESHSGGHGGLGYGGSINTYGGMGSSHTNDDQYSPNNACEGQGGASYFGGSMVGDRPDYSLTQVAAPGTGGIAISPSHNGQGGRTGRDGCVLVYEYI
jgi:hypothetical protein